MSLEGIIPLLSNVKANWTPSTPPRTQQIADLTAHAEAAVAQARADPTGDRAALAAQLEERAQWAEEGEADGSPYHVLAAHLRALAAQLDAAPAADDA